MIGEAAERFTKNLWTERKSAGKPQLVTRARRGRAGELRLSRRSSTEREAGTALKAQAVLFRASHHSGPLEIELTRRNIPFVKFGGLKFLDAAHVKDVLAVLRFAENPRDRVAGFRVLQLLPGIGPSAAAQIIDAMATSLDRGDRAGGASGRRNAPPTTGRVSSRCSPGCAPGRQTGRADLERVRLWYEPHLERIHEDATTRRADLAAARADRRRLSLARALPHRADARSAGRDQRPRPARRISTRTI